MTLFVAMKTFPGKRFVILFVYRSSFQLLCSQWQIVALL